MPTLKTKDAIVDRLRDAFGRRPDAGGGYEGAAVYTYWNETTLHCFLDTTGEPLSRRGYRHEPWLAPMQETLAAAALMATPYAPEIPLVVPMCGSGTPAIEAALIAKNRAPGSFRDHFTFMALNGYGDLDDWARVRKGLDRGWYQAEKDFTVTQTDPAAPRLHALTPSVVWNLMLTAARRDERPADLPVAPIIATDIAQGAIEATRKNARFAGVTELLQTHVCDFADTPLPPAPAVLFVNPEYGERLGDMEELPATYARIGEFLKTRCQGYRIFILTGNTFLSSHRGLKASRVLPGRNGPIECKILEFEIFKTPADSSDSPNP
jgi:putative N6-adenine-specific DNA methylase